MKVRVLWPTAFSFMEAPPEAGDVITIDEAHGKDLVGRGSAEEVRSRTETTSAAPDKPRAASKPRRKASSA